MVYDVEKILLHASDRMAYASFELFYDICLWNSLCVHGYLSVYPIYNPSRSPQIKAAAAAILSLFLAKSPTPQSTTSIPTFLLFLPLASEAFPPGTPINVSSGLESSPPPDRLTSLLLDLALLIPEGVILPASIFSSKTPSPRSISMYVFSLF